MKIYHYYHSPIGLMELTAEDKKLCSVSFCDSQEHDEDENEVLKEAIGQLKEYFNGQRELFDLPLRLSCSDFRHDIYTQLMQVPFSQSISYKTLASLSNHPGASRAVGSAMAANDFVIIIPCHRVIKSDGGLGNYSGGNGVETKKWLLAHERANRYSAL